MEHHRFGSDDASQLFTRERLSELIGLIYDCTLDPTVWAQVIPAIGSATNCFAGMLAVTDLETSTVRFAHIWNYEPVWLARLPAYADDVAQLEKKFLTLRQGLGDPGTASREMPEAYESRYNREWVEPQGIVDVLSLIVMRQPDRLGTLSFSRHGRSGLVTEEDIAVLRLLAPHIRRAIAISDLFGMQAVETATFGSVLDSFQFGILLVDRDLAIVHANAAANTALAGRGPLYAEKGKAALRGRPAQHALERAVQQAASGAAALGGSGIGIPVGDKERPCVVHVLPLRQSQLRSGLGPRAVVALFIAPASLPSHTPSDALAVIYDLTPAETKIFALIAAGLSQAEIADKFGIAPSTVKSHLLRLFAKTGCHRQSDLMKLAADLSVPV